MEIRTPKQKERQKYRIPSNGRYSQVNRCNICNKNAGIDYYSHHLTDTIDSNGEDWGDLGLVLCERCCADTEDITTVAEFKKYKLLRNLT